MYCKHCGSNIEDSSQFCEYCGGKVDPKVEVVNDLIHGEKSRLAAGLFAIFFGDIGIHHFYMGNITNGVICILFSWSGIPALIGVIQGIIYLSESEESFQRRIKKS